MIWDGVLAVLCVGLVAFDRALEAPAGGEDADSPSNAQVPAEVKDGPGEPLPDDPKPDRPRQTRRVEGVDAKWRQPVRSAVEGGQWGEALEVLRGVEERSEDWKRAVREVVTGVTGEALRPELEALADLGRPAAVQARLIVGVEAAGEVRRAQRQRAVLDRPGSQLEPFRPVWERVEGERGVVEGVFDDAERAGEVRGVVEEVLRRAEGALGGEGWTVSVRVLGAADPPERTEEGWLVVHKRVGDDAGSLGARVRFAVALWAVEQAAGGAESLGVLDGWVREGLPRALASPPQEGGGLWRVALMARAWMEPLGLRGCVRASAPDPVEAWGVAWFVGCMEQGRALRPLLRASLRGEGGAPEAPTESAWERLEAEWLEWSASTS